MYRFQSGLVVVRSLVRVTQRSNWRSHRSGRAPCLLMMLIDWAISRTRSLTFIFICWVVTPLFSCPIPMVFAAHWLTPTPAFSAQTRGPCTVGIRIVLSSAMTNFGNQNASHYILGSQLWSISEWWISNTCYSEQVSGVLNISSRVMWCGSTGEEGESNVLESVSRVGMQREYIDWLGGLSWSGDTVLAAIPLGINLLSIS